jgi:YfiH family protein
MQSEVVAASIESTSIGRIAVPRAVPYGFALFYTTIDFDGRLNPESVDKLMGIVRDRFDVDATLTTCTQVHGATVVSATGGEAWRECDSCDALWSDQKQTALGIKVADCLPVTLIDAQAGVIANIHSGWRGAVQQITAKTLDALPAGGYERTAAYLGPTIRVCCFEVGEEVASQFDPRFVDRSRGPKPHVDIAAFTADVLRSRGIRKIVDTELCTRCDGSIFHSYRRGAQGGRNLAIVAQ